MSALGIFTNGCVALDCKQDVCCKKGGDDLFDVMNSLGDISCKIAPCIRDPPQGKITIQADSTVGKSNVRKTCIRVNLQNR